MTGLLVEICWLTLFTQARMGQSHIRIPTVRDYSLCLESEIVFQGTNWENGEIEKEITEWEGEAERYIIRMITEQHL